MFVNEVSDYIRASFSDPQELLKAIVQGLSRMEKSKNSLPEKAFHERIMEASGARSYSGHSAPKLEFAFLPQPVEQHAVHGTTQRRDDIFQSLHNLGLAKFKQGYEEWDDRSFTGLK
ncbi:hypothetical protein [Pseudomonas savastanoi]|uniref:hypothetical protein n=1 Tax=Pseudomonas savastanoi TaxID=29438 RepID=UPI001F247515|nr:hypothetical protein [Pseudomonas savastanoi]